MTDALDTAIDEALQSLADIDDPVERYQVSRRIRTSIESGSAALKQTQADIALELKTSRSWREVGLLMGVTGARAEQISKGK
ncbi:hypothetical protein ACIREK_30995 [Streptomyces sp. NPDC102415]|uniref:hypothetical protein n=1 Tax=Streptomyces sp. NPDC102415 TaxID=3366173 RepID=UPI00382C6429